MTTQKLIKEYEFKISNNDRTIKLTIDSIIRIGKESIDTRHYLSSSQPFRRDRDKAETQRQCYIQIIADLKSLN